MSRKFRYLQLISKNIQSNFDGFDKLKFRFHRTRTKVDHFSPFFIVGAPRSGTTLIWQDILSSFRMGFISNLGALFMNKIILVTESQKILGKMKWNSIEPSKYGYISGLFAPNEGGAISRLWYSESNSRAHILAVRGIIDHLSSLYGAPMLMKNTKNSFRIEQIRKVHPDAKFIHIVRDCVYNAQSILLANKSLSENKNSDLLNLPDSLLFSDFHKLSSAEKASKQVNIYNSEIRRRMSDNDIEISYEGYTKDRIGFLKTVSHFLNIEFKEKHLKIESRNKVLVEPQVWETLYRVCQEEIPD